MIDTLFRNRKIPEIIFAELPHYKRRKRSVDKFLIDEIINYACLSKENRPRANHRRREQGRVEASFEFDLLRVSETLLNVSFENGRAESSHEKPSAENLHGRAQKRPVFLPFVTRSRNQVLVRVQMLQSVSYSLFKNEPLDFEQKERASIFPQQVNRRRSL
jgi:hypothetical protein